MTDPKIAVDTTKSVPIVAFVAVATEKLLTVAEIAQQVIAFDPSAAILNPVEQQGKILSFSFNGNLAAVTLMPKAIPWRELEGPCATAWWWPDATDSMQRHRHHLLVALIGHEGDALSRQLDATRLVAAAAQLPDSIGVYWGAGTLVHKAEEFVQQVSHASRDHVPIHLWIDMRLEQNADASYRFFTTGMSQFNQKELEILSTKHTPSEILELAYDVIHFVIAHNVAIADGETIGRTADQKIRIIHGPSMWNANHTVLHIEW